MQLRERARFKSLARTDEASAAEDEIDTLTAVVKAKRRRLKSRSEKKAERGRQKILAGFSHGNVNLFSSPRAAYVLASSDHYCV